MSDNLNGAAQAWTPDPCTLPDADKPLRQAEFDDLFATAVQVERPTERHVRILLAGSAEFANRVRALAARESECCSFFTFTVTPQMPDRVAFDIEVPAAHVDVLDALVRRASQAMARP